MRIGGDLARNFIVVNNFQNIHNTTQVENSRNLIFATRFVGVQRPFNNESVGNHNYFIRDLFHQQVLGTSYFVMVFDPRELFCSCISEYPVMP